MKKSNSIKIFILLTLISCDEKSSKSENKIIYQDWNDSAFSYLKSINLDLDGDNSSDFSFTTSLFQENNKTVLKFLVNGNFANSVLYDTSKNQIAILTSEVIESFPQKPKIWNLFENELCGIVYNSQTDSVWKGNWSQVSHKYLGVRFSVEGLQHYGWISLSADTTHGRMIIDESAYHSTPGKSVFAGQRSE